MNNRRIYSSEKGGIALKSYSDAIKFEEPGMSNVNDNGRKNKEMVNTTGKIEADSKGKIIRKEYIYDESDKTTLI